MTLVQSWIDSLQLLKPKNLQLFAMVTLKSIVEAYKLLFKYFWWLIAGIVILFFISPDVSLAKSMANREALALYAQILGLAYCLYTLLFLAACFVTRPSIGKKNCYYFLGLYKKFIFIWLVWFALGTLLAVNRSLLYQFFNLNCYSPWYIFFVLFFADSESTMKNFFNSLWNALKIIIFNLPILIMVGLCFRLVAFVAYMYIAPFTIQLLAALLLPIGICTYTNIYIKKLHDQFDLYFKQPQ